MSLNVWTCAIFHVIEYDTFAFSCLSIKSNGANGSIDPGNLTDRTLTLTKDNWCMWVILY